MKSTNTHDAVLKDLANTMLGVSRESVALMKRTDQQSALKLNRTQEWEVYFEFLRVQFNLVDRLSAFYIPVQEQPEFMDSLEDSVTVQLRAALASSMSSAEVDEMEVTLAIGQTVAESRQIFEKYRFVVTEQSKDRDAFFQAFGERVAGKMGASGSESLTSAAFLCANSVVPALTKLFEDATNPDASSPVVEATAGQAAGAAATHMSTALPEGAADSSQAIKIVRVMSKVSGEAVDTWWGVHPQFQRDLSKKEANELAGHMNRVSRIIGERFAVVASLAQTGGNQPVGHA